VDLHGARPCTSMARNVVSLNPAAGVRRVSRRAPLVGGGQLNNRGPRTAGLGRDSLRAAMPGPDAFHRSIRRCTRSVSCGYLRLRRKMTSTKPNGAISAATNRAVSAERRAPMVHSRGGFCGSKTSVLTSPQRMQRKNAMYSIRSTTADRRTGSVSVRTCFMSKTSPHPVGRESGFEIDWSRENYVVVMERGARLDR
jgi:hypothetical protein